MLIHFCFKHFWQEHEELARRTRVYAEHSITSRKPTAWADHWTTYSRANTFLTIGDQPTRHFRSFCFLGSSTPAARYSVQRQQDDEIIARIYRWECPYNMSAVMNYAWQSSHISAPQYCRYVRAQLNRDTGHKLVVALSNTGIWLNKPNHKWQT